jgi:predicted HD superfamily hydrolase involved in NAD metabolism
MDYSPYMAYLNCHLSAARVAHSIGVMRVMEELAPIYDLEANTAQLAGLVHDVGKELSQSRMESIAREIHFSLDKPANRDPLYLHGPCSAFVAEHALGIDDHWILEAITRHAYVGDGQARSPKFCWCLRFADMLEPGRDWHDLHARLQPLVFSGQMGEAARELMEWLFPFLERLKITPNQYQRVLLRKLKSLSAEKLAKTPFDQLPA